MVQNVFIKCTEKEQPCSAFEYYFTIGEYISN